METLTRLMSDKNSNNTDSSTSTDELNRAVDDREAVKEDTRSVAGLVDQHSDSLPLWGASSGFDWQGK